MENRAFMLVLRAVCLSGLAVLSASCLGDGEIGGPDEAYPFASAGTYTLVRAGSGRCLDVNANGSAGRHQHPAMGL
jgi:hypothetical protein